MTEADFWRKIRSAWPGHAMRLEASEGGVEPGCADSILSIGGRGMFVELKVWPEELRPLQLPWHMDVIDRGGGAEVWAWLPNGQVWAGSAEDYQRLLDERERFSFGSPPGYLLGVQLRRIQKILLSKSALI